MTTSCWAEERACLRKTGERAKTLSSEDTEEDSRQLILGSNQGWFIC